MLNWHH